MMIFLLRLMLWERPYLVQVTITIVVIIIVIVIIIIIIDGTTTLERERRIKRAFDLNAKRKEIDSGMLSITTTIITIIITNMTTMTNIIIINISTFSSWSNGSLSCRKRRYCFIRRTRTKDFKQLLNIISY